MTVVKKYSLSKFVLNLLLFFLISYSIFGNIRVTWYFLDISIFSFFLLYLFKTKSREDMILLCSILILSLLAVSSIIISGKLNIIQLVKYYYYIRPLLLIRIFLFSKKHSIIQYNKFISKLYYFSLIFFIINTFIIISQFNSGVVGDNLNGLMGTGANPVMAFSYILLLVLLRFYKNYNLIILSTFSIIMLFLTSLASIRVFPVMIVLVWIYIFFENGIGIKNTLKIGAILISTLIVIIYIINTNKYMSSYSNYVTHIYTSHYVSEESMGAEREYILRLALEVTDSLLWGSGIGSYSKTLGFKGENFNKYNTHLDMNDFTLIILECGILFYIILVSSIVLLLINLFNNILHKKLLFLFLFFFINFLFYYTRFVSDPRRLFSGLLIFIIVSHCTNVKQYNMQTRCFRKKRTLRSI